MEKIYSSIAEVSDLLKINQPTLRFWEKEFKQLNPRRTPKGVRSYSKEDIQIIKQISFLVNEKKLTIAGARIKLSDKKDLVAKQQELIERLEKVRASLKGIASHLPNE